MNADRALVERLTWYHTIELGDGLVTPGIYDHRPFLHRYGLPEDLRGKTALDVGAASGFFAFEMERRGARVTTVDLPTWFDHDFGPLYQPDHSAESGQEYLHEPLAVAARILGSRVERRHANIYDLSADAFGQFDLVFCGSLLIHLTDPLRALFRLAQVTRGLAVVATVVTPDRTGTPVALLTGHERGDSWWVPTRACFELMAACAGFAGVRWVDEFHLDLRDGTRGPYHGVLHAYKTTDGWAPGTVARDELIARHRGAGLPDLPDLRGRVAELEARLAAYERGRFMRLMRWLKGRGLPV